MNYFIGGIPCCYKTTFGDWLQERGWLHIDMEEWEGKEDGTPQWRMWEKYKNTDPQHFLDKLNLAAPNVVFTWGFQPHKHDKVRKRFRDCGVILWWFYGDHAATRDAFILRKKRTVQEFDHQVSQIRAYHSQLNELFGANQLQTMDQKGVYLTCEEIAKVVGIRLAC